MTARGWGICAGIVVLAGLSGYGFGRYAQPARVVTVTKTEVKTVTEWKDRETVRTVEGPVRKVTVIRSVPSVCAGVPETTTTVTEERGPVTIARVDEGSGSTAATATAQSSTIVTREQPRWLLQAGVASGSDFKPAWNVGASYRLIGPFFAGAAYHLTDKRLEARVGLSF